MASTTTSPEAVTLKPLKRGDLVAEEVKRWITVGRLRPGDKLPKEAELQRLFAVSKATTREALKSLEVQGLITVSTGPNGGATVAEVPFGRTFQLLQNYLYFKNVDVEHIYALRKLVEPELAAGAVPFLQVSDLTALERSIEFCAPIPGTQEHALQQREEDLQFHDILARANPNPLLRLMAEMLNEMLRQLVAFSGGTSHQQYQRFGRANVEAHRAILKAARDNDPDAVRALMLQHIVDAEKQVKKLDGILQNKLVLDSDLDLRITPRRGGAE